MEVHERLVGAGASNGVGRGCYRAQADTMCKRGEGGWGRGLQCSPGLWIECDLSSLPDDGLSWGELVQVGGGDGDS